MSYTNDPRVRKYRTQINGKWEDSNWWEGTHKMKDTGLGPDTLEASKRKFTGAGDVGTVSQVGTAALGIANSFVQKSEANREGPGSMGGAILEGATMGATMGSVAGPWGTAIGAAVGGAAGGINNSFEQKAYEDANKRKESLDNREQEVYGKGLLQAQKAEAFNRYVG